MVANPSGAHGAEAKVAEIYANFGLTAFSEVYALGSVLCCIRYTSQTTTAATRSTAAVTRPTFFQGESLLNHSRQRLSRRATRA